MAFEPLEDAEKLLLVSRGIRSIRIEGEITCPGPAHGHSEGAMQVRGIDAWTLREDLPVKMNEGKIIVKFEDVVRANVTNKPGNAIHRGSDPIAKPCEFGVELKQLRQRRGRGSARGRSKEPMNSFGNWTRKARLKKLDMIKVVRGDGRKKFNGTLVPGYRHPVIGSR